MSKKYVPSFKKEGKWETELSVSKPFELKFDTNYIQEVNFKKFYEPYVKEFDEWIIDYAKQGYNYILCVTKQIGEKRVGDDWTFENEIELIPSYDKNTNIGAVTEIIDLTLLKKFVVDNNIEYDYEQIKNALLKQKGDKNE
jgi:hypothetical protein